MFYRNAGSSTVLALKFPAPLKFIFFPNPCVLTNRSSFVHSSRSRAFRRLTRWAPNVVTSTFSSRVVVRYGTRGRRLCFRGNHTDHTTSVPSISRRSFGSGSARASVAKPLTATATPSGGWRQPNFPAALENDRFDSDVVRSALICHWKFVERGITTLANFLKSRHFARQRGSRTSAGAMAAQTRLLHETKT